jgi:hypothetical protein
MQNVYFILLKMNTLELFLVRLCILESQSSQIIVEALANQLEKDADFSVRARKIGKIVCGKYYLERRKT